MAKDLQQVSLLDLVPPNLREDVQVQAAATALDAELNAATGSILECLHLPRIDELPERVLDLLAWQWHVDFYEPVGISLETKRKLVKNVIKWHREKGTPAVVEEVANAIYEPSSVVEWFEYGGQPYRFKVRTEEIPQTQAERAIYIRALNSVKNTRSWLEAIEYVISLSETIEYTEKHAMATTGSIHDSYFLRGRNFDGGWRYTAPVAYGGEWSLDGKQRHNGALTGEDDPITHGRRFDAAWQLDGSKTFALANPTRKVSFNTEEPEELHTTPTLAQSDAHSVVLLFDSASRKMDGLQTFGAVHGPQDANDVHVDAVLRQVDDVETSEAVAMQTPFQARDNYPLPRMQYFSGAWAFGQSVTHDGSQWFGAGEKYDGLPGLPDPAVTPVLLNGKNKFDGANVLGVPQPVVTFGADIDAADAVALDVQLTGTETVSSTEAVSVTVVGILEDFAYADVRLDGSFQFGQAACFDGFWLQRGVQLHDGIPVMRADALPEPKPLAGLFDGRQLFNGGAKAIYDGTLTFESSPVNADIRHFEGRLLQEEGEIYPCFMLQDRISQAAHMDGVNTFSGTWNLTEVDGLGEQEHDKITIGRWFGGGWQFDAGNNLYFDGTRSLDGSFFHALLGDCRNHFDGNLLLDGSNVFWKGGETFEHYRCAAN